MHAALQGINQLLIDKRKELRVECWRCGRNSHYTLDCFANTSLDGKVLPPAPGMIVSMPAQKENPVPEITSSGIISAAMAAANIAIGLDPVEDPSVPEDYTLSVPIFQKNYRPPIMITRLRRAVLKEGCDKCIRPNHKII